jgi:hypothetical protein
MSDPQPIQDNLAQSESGPGSLKVPLNRDPELFPAAALPSPTALTADQQMALYEKALKEDDCGHQPC